MIRRCIDCTAEGITTNRKLATKRNGQLEPGPRCVTHHRARRQVTRDASWARRILLTYAITAAEYWKIFLHQGEQCAICHRAKGRAKKLSVDHDHATGYVRGLLCTRCNNLLGHLRDDLESAKRVVRYLEDPPAFAVVGQRVAPIEKARINA